MLTPSSFSVLCQRFYVATSRHLKRLDSVSRSPIYSHFSETVTGTSVVRAYGCSQDFKAISDAKADTNMRSSYPYVTSNRSQASSLTPCSSKSSHQGLCRTDPGVLGSGSPPYIGNCPLPVPAPLPPCLVPTGGCGSTWSPWGTVLCSLLHSLL